MGRLDQLYSDKSARGDIVCRKAYHAAVERLRIVDGFNIRKIDKEHVAFFAAAYLAGKEIPPLFISVAEDGMLDIVDGHHRYLGFLQAMNDGMAMHRLPVIEFDGDENDKVVLAIETSQGKPLSPIDRAGAYQRLRVGGCSNTQIAKRLHRTEGDVGNYLLLWDCGAAVHALVEAGRVSPTLVFDLARKHGSDKVQAILESADVPDDNGEKAKKIKVSSITKKDGEVLANVFGCAWVSCNEDGYNFCGLTEDEYKQVATIIAKVGLTV